MRKSYDPDVYVAMRDGGLTNRKIGRLLSVSEASVRRGLKKAKYVPNERSPLRALMLELAELLERDRV